MAIVLGFIYDAILRFYDDSENIIDLNDEELLYKKLDKFLRENSMKIKMMITAEKTRFHEGQSIESVDSITKYSLKSYLSKQSRAKTEKKRNGNNSLQ